MRKDMSKSNVILPPAKSANFWLTWGKQNVKTQRQKYGTNRHACIRNLGSLQEQINSHGLFQKMQEIAIMKQMEWKATQLKALMGVSWPLWTPTCALFWLLRRKHSLALEFDKIFCKVAYITWPRHVLNPCEKYRSDTLLAWEPSMGLDV